ncbi:hypothetical protein [Segatella paludivivens]|uniref:hypothetical protein n=1 Tax=Segatella paludivivens TaxID=185294 RepID=UPI0012DE40BA|nr:hypothetical protein [Segatella paludivivens]
MRRLCNQPVEDDDQLVKKQLIYFPAGRAGDNVLWNLGMIEVVNERYEVGNTLLKDKKTIAQTEMNTRYFYQNEADGLYLKGYENNQTRISYFSPRRELPFPMNYGDSINDFYRGYAVSDDHNFWLVFGQSESKIDAYGKLILPQGDTLRNVARIHTINKAIEYGVRNVDNEAALKGLSDSLHLSDNDIKALIQQSEGAVVTEHYKWYAKGYRYPILESIVSVKDSLAYSTSYYYPPSEVEYLASDKENEKIRSSLLASYGDGSKLGLSDHVGFTYNVILSGDQKFLRLEYDLLRSATVSYAVYTLDGKLIASEEQRTLRTGTYHENISFPIGVSNVFIITFHVNDARYACKISKK